MVCYSLRVAASGGQAHNGFGAVAQWRSLIPRKRSTIFSAQIMLTIFKSEQTPGLLLYITVVP